MIVLKEKKDCCGCSACAQRCPKLCITMQSDNEGFLYPCINTEQCIDCGLCEKVCPVINRGETTRPIVAYAAMNKNEEIRLASSSGGIFTLLAEAVINEGGVVFGVKFNESWQAVFDYTETIEGLAPFRGSKYVQAIVGNAYKTAEGFLKAGRKVLFTGTPCQIAGLNKYLRKDYENLLTVDIICHGAPSPLVWKEYVAELIRAKRGAGKNSVSLSLNDEPVLTGISFRDKTNSWKKYCFRATFAASKAAKNTVSEPEYILETFNKNKFMQGFLRDIYLRPSCYSCPAKNGISNSDITIGDFWGIEKHLPEMDDDKGTSAVLVNSHQAEDFINRLPLHKTVADYESIVTGNSALVKSVARNSYTDLFWKTFASHGIDAILLVCKKMQPSIINRLFQKIKRKVKTYK